jgi:lipopolysaccharide transport system ATP-binding protein
MSDNVIIAVENLGKKYSLRHLSDQRYIALRDVLVEKATGLFRRNGKERVPTREEFWALRNVNFEVKQGEVLGIIGRNGAGKSTLLKILSRITEPTEGRVRIKGRVASLLEVGTGFNPELTGRENIFLNGSILGMTRAEITRKFDEIVTFAEVEKFIDTPVKRYSSGMYVRLAFAVAAHLEPEILVIDEVLAVGDAEFQKKCLGKMGEVAHAGRTVLFVSHNMSTIQSLCSRGILLQQGTVRIDANPSRSVRVYLEEGAVAPKYWRSKPVTARPSICDAVIEEIEDISEPHLDVRINIASRNPRLVAIDLRISDALGVPVAFGSVGTTNSQMVDLLEGANDIRLRIPTEQLAIGSYVLSIDVSDPYVEYFDRAETCLAFEINRAARAGGRGVMQQQWGFGSVELAIQRLK